MADFRCTRFPRGVARIRTPGRRVVHFIDGRATVDDADLAADLLRVPPVFGVVQVDGQALGPSGGEVPDGPVADVLAWVGEDRERAAQALAAEQARGDRARSTLVVKLEALR